MLRNRHFTVGGTAVCYMTSAVFLTVWFLLIQPRLLSHDVDSEQLIGSQAKTGARCFRKHVIVKTSGTLLKADAAEDSLFANDLVLFSFMFYTVPRLFWIGVVDVGTSDFSERPLESSSKQTVVVHPH